MASGSWDAEAASPSVLVLCVVPLCFVPAVIPKMKNVVKIWSKKTCQDLSNTFTRNPLLSFRFMDANRRTLSRFITASLMDLWSCGRLTLEPPARQKEQNGFKKKHGMAKNGQRCVQQCLHVCQTVVAGRTLTSPSALCRALRVLWCCTACIKRGTTVLPEKNRLILAAAADVSSNSFVSSHVFFWFVLPEISFCQKCLSLPSDCSARATLPRAWKDKL